MKKLIYILLLFFLIVPAQYTAANAMVLKAGVSLSDQVPAGFFGSWEISSIMTYTNNEKMFNEVSTDYWNLSKTGDVITLSNPVSGARASVTVDDVKGNQIKFTHVTQDKNAKMTETPTLTLNGENFYGTDKIVIEKYKYGEKISTDVVIYKIKAKKISGNSAQSIQSIFMSRE